MVFKLDKEEYFYCEDIENIHVVITDVVFIITTALTPIIFYIISTQSKGLGNIKYFILNHTFWCYALEVILYLIKPTVLLPAGESRDDYCFFFGKKY